MISSTGGRRFECRVDSHTTSKGCTPSHPTPRLPGPIILPHPPSPGIYFCLLLSPSYLQAPDSPTRLELLHTLRTAQEMRILSI